MSPTPWDESTHYTIETSDTASDVDGYNVNEPKYLVCDGCGAREKLTEDPSAGVDDLSHSKDCPQRFARSEWWREQLEAGD